MRYKVGDKVKIREDLVVGKEYGADDFARGMKPYKGKIATITSVCGDTYRIDIDDNDYKWHWTDEMFEGAKNEKIVDIGYYLDYCGHRVIENVYYGGYAYDSDHVFCTTVDGKNQYTLPVNSIEFIIPHED